MFPHGVYNRALKKSAELVNYSAQLEDVLCRNGCFLSLGILIALERSSQGRGEGLKNARSVNFKRSIGTALLLTRFRMTTQKRSFLSPPPDPGSQALIKLRYRCLKQALKFRRLRL